MVDWNGSRLKNVNKKDEFTRHRGYRFRIHFRKEKQEKFNWKQENFNCNLLWIKNKTVISAFHQLCEADPWIMLSQDYPYVHKTFLSQPAQKKKTQ